MYYKAYLKIYQYINVISKFILNIKNIITYKYLIYLFKKFLILIKLNELNFDFDIIQKI